MLVDEYVSTFDNQNTYVFSKKKSLLIRLKRWIKKPVEVIQI